jgi:hypothetical protein
MDSRWQRRRAYKAHAHDGSGGRWSPCPECGKRTYWSRRSAKTAARQGIGGRPYECERPGTRRWHLTTIDADSRQWFREQYERGEDDV